MSSYRGTAYGSRRGTRPVRWKELYLYRIDGRSGGVHGGIVIFHIIPVKRSAEDFRGTYTGAMQASVRAQDEMRLCDVDI